MNGKDKKHIYLFGELHGVAKIYEEELSLWREFYNKNNMRHLFIESPYYTAEFLNVWMREDNDAVLNKIFNEWSGTPAANPYKKSFLKNIKNECPETIFHGTDVGHQFDSTGVRYLKYLEDHNMEDSVSYILAKEAIEQGKNYYSDAKTNDNRNHVYRENKMADNFIREFDIVNGESVMGIYGAAHTALDGMDFMTNSVHCMAAQLKKRYGDDVHSEDLSWIKNNIKSDRVETLNINGREYEASYFGKYDMAGFKELKYREIWRIEKAYDIFKDHAKTGEVLPYNNYPMLIKTGQVFVIDYTKNDDSVERIYYRSDGSSWNNMRTTEAFIIE